ncbi:hypothetical protein D6D01_00900 [Aureobasidium pullulans]|uniref:BRCT domain-containing protein n=1 Tax=Aureobasidium pullulans TaxID=5580 RepID=A0A4S9M0G2_AURPU|nr:hypothetical protein D6D01_00900 [Aureobasidium pullulans]
MSTTPSMVATRAMAAKKAPESDDNQLALRKKPVRRATAKKSAPSSPKKDAQITAVPVKPVAARPKRQTRIATAPPAAEPIAKRAPTTRRKAALPEAARAKVTRSKKTQPDPEPELESEHDFEAQLDPEVKSQPTPELEAQPEAEIESQPGPGVETKSEAEPEVETQLEAGEKSEVNEEQEPEETHVPISPLPMPSFRVTHSHDVQTPAEEPSEEAKDNEDSSSEDEICGPKTPMRRTTTATRSQTTSRKKASTTSTRKLHTPARDLLVHRANQGTPQTQRMPLRSTRNSSPARPMTVARGLSKPMVFRQLKQQSPHQTPESGITDHLRDPEIVQEKAHEESSSESELEESSADELDDQLDNIHHGEICIMPTPARTIHFESVASDSEDELAANAQVSDDDYDLDEDTVVEEDNKKESDYINVEPDEADDTSDDSCSDIDDSVLPEPHFSADFTTSMPSSPASITAELPHTDVQDSEMLSSPTPSTPSSIAQHDLEEDVSPTKQITPVARLSLGDRELLSLIEDEGSATPDVEPRVSFSTTTAKMLQTPRMQFALGGADTSEVEDSPSITVTEPVETDKTMTINPLLLEVDEHGVKLASNLENAAAIPTPYFATPTARERLSMGFPKERMSLLQDDIFNFVDFDHVSPVKENAQTSTVEDASYDPEPMEMSTPGYNSRRQSHCSRTVSTPNDQAKERRNSSGLPLISPNYARSTFAFDSRRKSLPTAGLQTPLHSDLRARTAETAIKPSTSDSFAKLWASKQRRSSVRRSILDHAVPELAEIHSMVPEEEQRSTRKRNSTLSQRSTSTNQLQTRAASPYMSFPGAKPRRHTPSSSFKVRTSGRSPLKTRSSSRSPIKIRSSSRSPMKLRNASRSPVKRLLEAPRTPMKTPLKGPCLATPAAYPMTPHPLQPLKSVTALVEVFTLDGSSASGPFIALLQGLGARTTKAWSDRVTHVIFKDGSPTTLQRVRVNNKDPNGKKIFCVNSRWVTDCERNGTRMDEQTDIYTVDLDEVPRGGRRRRKSMEPAALRNVDGNIVHSNNSSANSSANRKSISSRQSIVGGRQSINLTRANKSLARVSLASSFWGEDSPVKKTPGRKQARDSWDDDEEMADAFFDEPTGKFEVPASLGVNGASLEAGQMTAPVDRVRKLRIRDEDNRRLTFMGGRE